MGKRRCGILRLGFLTAAFAAAAGFTPVALADTIQASALAKQLGLRQTITAKPGTVIRGPLNLQPVGVVRAAFECWRCTFEGGVFARHVIFEREIDLGGVTIKGRLDLRGATFTRPVQLGSSPGAPAIIRGPVDLTGATFAGLADVQETQFESGVVVQFARFRGDAFFDGVDFQRWADFSGAVFDGRARFARARFASAVNYLDALFGGGVDFGHASFSKRAHFRSADFRGPTTFAEASFYDGADFAEARLKDGATFARSQFGVRDPRNDLALSLLSAVAQQGLDFTRATFGEDVSADQMIASRLNFNDATFTDPAVTLSMADSSIGDLRLSLEDLGHVPREQERSVLSLIESSAKDRNATSLANDAHYRGQELNAGHYGVVLRTADALFYRGVAGYFVRPLRPLVVLALCALAFAVGRRVRTAGLHAWGPRKAGIWLVGLGSEIFETFAVALPRMGGSGANTEQLGIGRRLEVLAYRLLFVCAPVGLANSNPALREMLDTIA
jgi:uncharacterized protein YjbI with pentapeptide repeats